MGSRTIAAMSEHRGNVSVNPEGLIPSTSSPIEQSVNPKSTLSESIILQRLQLTTAIIGVGDSASKPIQQIPSLENNTSSEPAEGFIMEQVISESPVDQTYDGIIQQLGFNNQEDFAGEATPARPLEQRITARQTDATGTPIEQKAKATNSINIEQFDFIELVFPPCNSIKNPVNTNLLWRIRDFGFPFNVDSLIFEVNGVEVQDSSNFSRTDLGTGLELFYNPPEDFQFEQIVTVFVQIEDTASPVNVFSVRCNFTTVPDTRAPIVSNVIPCGQSNVPVTHAVSFDVIDAGYGVDLSELILSIEGLAVCSGITIDELTLASGTGYHVVWEHTDRPFRYDSNVTVGIEAADLSPRQNRTLYLCSFNTESSNPPYFINFDPEPCSSFIDTATGLRFEVYGNVAGLDISTLEVRVDNNLRTVIVRPRVLRSL